ncbi:hypothetical protein ACMFMF_011936 [Clarireedia jacksonii]
MISNHSSVSFVTVKLAPSNVTYPFSTIYLITCLSLGLSLSVNASPSSSLLINSATVSTCPCTKCPPMRVFAETARSRLTSELTSSEPTFVRRRVSGAHPTVKLSLVKLVTVRQIPLTEMLSPSPQSPRMAAALLIVRVAPYWLSSLMSETTRFWLGRGIGRWNMRYKPPLISTRPVNIVNRS